MYADLGLADADTMQAKARAVAAMHQMFEERRFSLDHVAHLINIPAKELEAILSGQFRSHPLSALERMQKEIQQCTET